MQFTPLNGNACKSSLSEYKNNILNGEKLQWKGSYCQLAALAMQLDEIHFIFLHRLEGFVFFKQVSF